MSPGVGGRRHVGYASRVRFSGPRLALLTVALGATLATGCKEPKGVDVAPELLIPKDADIALGFELAAVRDSALAEPLKGMMLADPNMSALITGFEACGTDADKVVGMAAGSMTSENQFFLAMTAPDLGKRDTINCYEEKTREALGQKAQRIAFETKGDVSVAPMEDGGKLIILNKETILVMGPSWEQPVLTAIETPGERSGDTPLVKAIDAVEDGTDAWAVVVPSSADLAEVADLPGGDKMKSVTLSLGLESGLKVDAGLEFADAASATAFSGEIKPMLTDATLGLAATGLPPDLLDSAKTETEDTRVTIGITISPEQTATVLQLALAAAMM